MKKNKMKKHPNHSPATNILLKEMVEPKIRQGEDGFRPIFCPPHIQNNIAIASKASHTDEKL